MPMKKTFTSFIMLLLLCEVKAQSVVVDFENFTLASNSFYKDTNNNPFQHSPSSFEHKWTMGTFPYWSAGFSYTNKYDSTNGSFTNLYGVKAFRGYNNSNMYTVAQSNGKITLTVPQTTVEGFYYTNTTYAYASIKNGDSFARKFGDTTGTGSGTTIAQGDYPDYFKVTIKGYKDGIEKVNKVEFLLADYRFANSTQDYIVKDWRYVNTSTLGAVDSIKFEMYSTVANEWGILTPGFFALDNFATTSENPVGIFLRSSKALVNVFPNPFANRLTLQGLQPDTKIRIFSSNGNLVYSTTIESNETILQLEHLTTGLYFLETNSSEGKILQKIVKN